MGSHAGLLSGWAARRAHITGLTRGRVHTPGIRRVVTPLANSKWVLETYSLPNPPHVYDYEYDYAGADTGFSEGGGVMATRGGDRPCRRKITI